MFVSQGAGAFEVAARQHLMNVVKKTVQGVVFSIYPHLSMSQFSCDSSVLLDLFMECRIKCLCSYSVLCANVINLSVAACATWGGSFCGCIASSSQNSCR